MLSTGPTYPVWIQHLTKPAYVDVVAIIVKKEGKKTSIRLSVLNRHPDAAWEGELNFDHFGEYHVSMRFSSWDRS